MKNFGAISEITVDKPETWENRIFLTFDIDWAHDEVLEDTIDLVEEAGVAATWFVTHETPLLERLRANSKFELGIHPNFNDLLQGDTSRGATPEEIVDNLLAVVPEAKSVRSHSMTQNTKLLQLFCQKGLDHDCNHFIPEQAGLRLKPWPLWNGLIKVPYFWEDDIMLNFDEKFSLSTLNNREGIKVFDFHPIYVFLNTEALSRYEQVRFCQQHPDTLMTYRYTGEGIRTNLLDLLSFADSFSNSNEQETP